MEYLAAGKPFEVGGQVVPQMPGGYAGDAAALYPQLGRDDRGRSIVAERRAMLELEGVDERSALGLAYWAAWDVMDDEIASYASDKLKAVRQQAKPGKSETPIRTFGGGSI